MVNQAVRPVIDSAGTNAGQAKAPIRRGLLLGLFLVLMSDEMFGWGLGLGTGLSIKNAFLYLLITLLLFETALLRRRGAPEALRIQVPFILLILWACYSWISNTLLDLGVGYKAVASFIALKGFLIDHYLFFAAFFLATPTRRDAMWLIHWIMVFLIAANFLTVIDVYNVPDLGIIRQIDDGRVSGPLGEPNQYGAFVAMFLPILISLLPGTTGMKRLVYAFGVLLFAWVLLLTVSRGAFVGLLCGAGLAAVLLRRYLDARVLAAVGVGAGLVMIAALVLIGEEFVELLQSRTAAVTEGADAFEMSSGRTWIWMNALLLQIDRPSSFLLGYGWNTFLSLNPLNSHNTYLTYLFELGVPGLLLYLALLYGVLRTATGAMTRSADRAMTAGFIVGFSAVAVAVFFVNLAEPWYFIWAYVGVAMRVAVGDRGVVERAPPRLRREPLGPPAPVRDRRRAQRLLG